MRKKQNKPEQPAEISGARARYLLEQAAIAFGEGHSPFETGWLCEYKATFTECGWLSAAIGNAILNWARLEGSDKTEGVLRTVAVTIEDARTMLAASRRAREMEAVSTRLQANIARKGGSDAR